MTKPIIYTNNAACLTTAQQETCLTDTSKGSKLLTIVLGVGTQNYTCDSEGATPTPNGAVATLYDISCAMTVNYKAAHHLTTLAMRANVHGLTTANYGKVPLGLGYPEAGKHYFIPLGDASAAVFEIKRGEEYFRFAGKKLEGIAAPSSALEGSVDWLKLGRVPGKENMSWGIKVCDCLFFFFFFFPAPGV